MISNLIFVPYLATCKWNRVTREKSDKDIMTEIQAIMRQIAASVTFLPNIEEACTFDLLAYTSVDSEVRTVHQPVPHIFAHRRWKMCGSCTA